MKKPRHVTFGLGPPASGCLVGWDTIGIAGRLIVVPHDDRPTAVLCPRLTDEQIQIRLDIDREAMRPFRRPEL